MLLYQKIQSLLPEFTVELVTLENWNKYADVFYCNKEYFIITDGHTAAEDDCIDIIKYCPDAFPKEKVLSLGFSKNGEAVAFLSILEGYPDFDTLYIGLFLMNEKLKRKSIGSKIIITLITEALNSSYIFIKLSVQDNNISGLSFWRNIGFKEIDKYDCKGFSNLAMEYRK